MASLVADYSSDSESTSNSGSYDADEKKVESTALPKPDFKTDTTERHSVFANPFVEADKAKTAILEKHVKMISTDVKTVNGKKICWNYRKNKCRFGHKCKYAHDSDLQVDVSKISSETNSQDVKVQQTGNEMKTQEISLKKMKMKRSGMDDGFVPCGKIAKTTNQCKPKMKRSHSYQNVK